jgi:hypothetical protein
MKVALTFVCGAIFEIGGIFVRFHAYAMSESPRSATWGAGNWETTEWAFLRHAWSDVGNLAIFGGMLFVAVAFHHWIKGTGGDERNLRRIGG